jgi:uncharacterized integral membrane protein
MAQKRTNPRKTAGKLIIDELIKNKAIDEASAKPVIIFKDLPLASTLIAYTIANFMQDDIIIQTSDEKYYYSEVNWKKFASKFNRIYWMLIIVPAIILVIMLVIKAITTSL